MSSTSVGAKINNKIQGYVESAVAAPLAFLVRVVVAITGLFAAGLILTAFASFAGFKVPWFKTLGTTELAYAMGAWWLYKKA